jgi:hypothetical protein
MMSRLTQELNIIERIHYFIQKVQHCIELKKSVLKNNETVCELF